MTKRNTSMFDEMVSNLQEDHIPALRQIRTLAIVTHKLTRELCGVCCVYARDLRGDAKRRAEFYAEAFPNGWQRFHRGKLLLHVLMYFYGVTGSDCVGYGTASAHSIALREIYENRNISRDDVMRHIEASGIFASRQNDDDAHDDDEDDQEDDSETASGEGDRRSGVARRPIVLDPTLALDDCDLDDDDLVPGANEDDEPVAPPKRKVPKPESTEPKSPSGKG